jgi:hypothetical protein
VPNGARPGHLRVVLPTSRKARDVGHPPTAFIELGPCPNDLRRLRDGLRTKVVAGCILINRNDPRAVRPGVQETVEQGQRFRMGFLKRLFTSHHGNNLGSEPKPGTTAQASDRGNQAELSRSFLEAGTLNQPEQGPIVYLFLLGADLPSPKIINEALQYHQQLYGSNVRSLGGMRVGNGKVPMHPDRYVMAICLQVCQQNNIPFDRKTSEVAYGVGEVDGKPLGTCEITIGGHLAESPTKLGPHCGQCWVPLSVFSDDLAAASAALLQYEGTICAQCRAIRCDRCHPPSEGKLCACGGKLLPAFAKYVE